MVQARKFSFKQYNRRAAAADDDFATLRQQFPDDGDASGGMSQPPVERGNKNAEFLRFFTLFGLLHVKNLCF